MKKQLLKGSGLFALFLFALLGKTPEAEAQAYDMTYRDTLTANSPPQISHSFGFYLYQNCNPAPAGFSSFPVSYTSSGSTPVTEVMVVFPVQGMGNPFCASQPAVCSVSGPLNYQKSGYNSFTFATKLNTAAPGFHSILTQFPSFGGGIGNFQAANISGNFGIEPSIMNAVTPGLINVAPEFVNPPVIFANVNQPVSYSLAATDADGDSLVYKLRPASPGATYAAGFTFLNPITANPALALNSRTGVITFKPTAYDQTAGPGATANKYIIGLDVDEYRKLNGVTTKIGTIQRNVLVNVISNANQSPVLSATQNATSLAPNTIIDALPGMPVTLNFGASDPDITDVVSPGTNAQNILTGSTFTVTLGSNPNGGQLNWTPTAADARDEPYFFNVTATDNACPYPASVTNTYGIRVRNITGLSPDKANATTFLAFPNPANHEVNFKITTEKPAREIIVYNVLGQELDRIKLTTNPETTQTIRWENNLKFPAGTYMAKLISADKTVQTLKFSKLQ